MSVMFHISMATGPYSTISEGFLHSILSALRRILGSWNLVNPLLSMNEAWMDECAARLQPLVDQYKIPILKDFAQKKMSTAIYFENALLSFTITKNKCRFEMQHINTNLFTRKKNPSM